MQTDSELCRVPISNLVRVSVVESEGERERGNRTMSRQIDGEN